MPRPIQLATLWHQPEKRSVDVAPGTWAEYFRWASIHVEQTRELAAVQGQDARDPSEARLDHRRAGHHYQLDAYARGSSIPRLRQ